jgi:signal recognition particle subunit SRP54
VIAGVQPDQQFIKIVYDELVQVMGKLMSPSPVRSTPTIVLMAGLQEQGKLLLRLSWLCTYASRIAAA